MRLIEVQKGHVRGVAFSPDGKYLATVGNDCTARLLEASSGQELWGWAESMYPEIAVAFSPDSRWVAWGGLSAAVGMASVDFRVGGPGPLPRFFSTARCDSTDWPVTVSCLAYSPGGQSLYVGTGERSCRFTRASIRCWDAATGSLRTVVRVDGGVQHVAVRPDGRQLAVGTGWGWHYVNTNTWGVSKVMTQGRTAPAVAYSPDGRTLAVSQGRNVCLQDVASGQFLRTLQGHASRVTTLAFTPDGQSLLSGSWDRTVRVWSPTTGQQKAALDWERGKVQYVAVAPDGMTAAAACDKGVVVWDLD